MSKSPTGAPKRAAVGLLAGALAVFGIALAPSAGAVEEAIADRVAGATRYGTAAAVATEAYPDGVDCVIIATGENFPDALAASGLAGTDGCPILLVTRDEVPEATGAAIGELGATSATIVGGTAAVSEGVETALEDDHNLTVDRIAGANRYETACDIAAEVGGDGSVVIVASGEVAADALSAGPIAANLPAPIVLATVNETPACSEDVLAGATEVLVVGGTARITDDNEAAIEDSSGDEDAERLAGQNRQETSVEVADYEVETLGWAPTAVLLAAPSAPNDDFSPDALVAGPLGGLREAPVLIVASVDSLGPAGDFIDDHSDTLTEVFCIGGTAVISEDLCDAAEAAAQNVENDNGGPAANRTATSRPELVSATITTVLASNATATRPAGTYVVYCFDEAVTGALPAPTLFKVWNGDGTPTTAETAAVTQADNKCVEGRFGSTAGTSAFDTVAEASVLTLATVAKGAVTGAGGAPGDTGIEGDSALTPTGASTAPATAGVTSGADLVSVGNFRAGFSEDVTAVDFTFDEAAFTNNINGYHLVTTGNDLIQCTGPAEDSTTTSGGTVAGGEGTTVHTVLCDEPLLGATFSAASIVRGFVDANTVDDADTFSAPGTPLEAADVSASGNSDGPSLDAVVFAPDATAGVDIVAFIFSESVAPAPIVAGNFAIYDVNGNELAPAGGASRSTENNSAVTAVYPDGTLSTAVFVGGNVRNDAVVDLQGEPNRGDELGTSPSAGTSRTSGKTDGPDLLSVVLTSGTSPFGNPTYRATYTFDEDTFDNEDPGGGVDATRMSGLHLYTADGIQLDCTALSATSNDVALSDRNEDSDASITCISFTVNGGAAATVAQIGSATVGTVEAGAVGDEAAGGDSNPEGHEVTTGGTGTPAT